MRWSVQIVICLVLLSAMGCARHSVSITSEPSGALVFVNGNEVGRTPMKFDFDDYADFDVVLRKDGYETLKTHQKIKTPLYGYPPLDLGAEAFGVKDHYEWRFDLTPESGEAADAAQLINRGQAMREDLQSSKLTRKPSTLPARAPATRPGTQPTISLK
ncbi:MAG: PEGA domain-containing protein [Tepidisphaerales bacterium]